MIISFSLSFSFPSLSGNGVLMVGTEQRGGDAEDHVEVTGACVRVCEYVCSLSFLYFFLCRAFCFCLLCFPIYLLSVLSRLPPCWCHYVCIYMYVYAPMCSTKSTWNSTLVSVLSLFPSFFIRFPVVAHFATMEGYANDGVTVLAVVRQLVTL